MSLLEVEELEEPEFKWGIKRGIGGKKKDVQFYESFTYDGVDYALYDCVYMYKEEVLENEIFFASGAGTGLANLNPLEAIAGKCNVVCISKDSRNPQLSAEELQMADFIFYRIFDVGSCTISDQMGDAVGGLEVKFVFNRKESDRALDVPKLDWTSKDEERNGIAFKETPKLARKNTPEQLNNLKPDENGLRMLEKEDTDVKQVQVEQESLLGETKKVSLNKESGPEWKLSPAVDVKSSKDKEPIGTTIENSTLGAKTVGCKVNGESDKDVKSPVNQIQVEERVKSASKSDNLDDTPLKRAKVDGTVTSRVKANGVKNLIVPGKDALAAHLVTCTTSFNAKDSPNEAPNPLTNVSPNEAPKSGYNKHFGGREQAAILVKSDGASTKRPLKTSADLSKEKPNLRHNDDHENKDITLAKDSCPTDGRPKKAKIDHSIMTLEDSDNTIRKLKEKIGSGEGKGRTDGWPKKAKIDHSIITPEDNDNNIRKLKEKIGSSERKGPTDGRPKKAKIDHSIMTSEDNDNTIRKLKEKIGLGEGKGSPMHVTSYDKKAKSKLGKSSSKECHNEKTSKLSTTSKDDVEKVEAQIFEVTRRPIVEKNKWIKLVINLQYIPSTTRHRQITPPPPSPLQNLVGTTSCKNHAVVASLLQNHARTTPPNQNRATVASLEPPLIRPLQNRHHQQPTAPCIVVAATEKREAIRSIGRRGRGSDCGSDNGRNGGSCTVTVTVVTVALMQRSRCSDASTEEPWEERMKTAHDQGKLVLLQNLDPEYTSGEVEDIIWFAFKENCTAKMVQHNANSNPHSGQAFVIFNSREAVDRVLQKLDERCLVLPNKRPLVISTGVSPKLEKNTTFVGHLVIDKARRQIQREMKEAVSTSHYSQNNTIEYEMAMSWCLLQSKSDKWWEKLYERIWQFWGCRRDMNANLTSWILKAAYIQRQGMFPVRKADVYEECEFEWVNKSGDSGFYESFTYDGLDYSLYDCVYMYKTGEPMPYIGKLVGIWENADKSKLINVQWFFRPEEISYYLRDAEVLKNELFFASGAGVGLTNINYLEAIAGKCNVVCISTDSRNPQPSVKELVMADYVFDRTFDVGSYTISDQFGDFVGGLRAEFVFNKKGSDKTLNSPKFDPKGQYDEKVAIACEETLKYTSKRTPEQFRTLKLEENCNHMMENQGTNAKQEQEVRLLGEKNKIPSKLAPEGKCSPGFLNSDIDEVINGKDKQSTVGAESVGCIVNDEKNEVNGMESAERDVQGKERGKSAWVSNDLEDKPSKRAKLHDAYASSKDKDTNGVLSLTVPANDTAPLVTGKRLDKNPIGPRNDVKLAEELSFSNEKLSKRGIAWAKENAKSVYAGDSAATKTGAESAKNCKTSERSLPKTHDFPSIEKAKSGNAKYLFGTKKDSGGAESSSPRQDGTPRINESPNETRKSGSKKDINGSGGAAKLAKYSSAVSRRVAKTSDMEKIGTSDMENSLVKSLNKGKLRDSRNSGGLDKGLSNEYYDKVGKLSRDRKDEDRRVEGQLFKVTRRAVPIAIHTCLGISWWGRVMMEVMVWMAKVRGRVMWLVLQTWLQEDFKIAMDVDCGVLHKEMLVDKDGVSLCRRIWVFVVKWKPWASKSWKHAAGHAMFKTVKKLGVFIFYEKSKWLGELPWEEAMKSAYDRGRLILLQNLDPEYTAGEVEDIIWCAFREYVTARMGQCTAISSPHSGQAFVIFKTREAVERVVMELDSGCLMLPNQRHFHTVCALLEIIPSMAMLKPLKPLVICTEFLPELPGRPTKFAGHLTIDKVRRKERREMVCPFSPYLKRKDNEDIVKEAVSTSHYAQPNTIEFEMAIEWRLLQSESDIWWKTLYKEHKEQLKKLVAGLNSKV
ncbi:hypothetical protein BUALT_Bualt10G0112000 [Buddleja alternifolia]|uniref:BAH domain-containing protein n=1 Tax=Buddleja alternifolia TaxID=168488 RepID=A0AAV6WYZ4_9LAMI|nr:hypothetical protein BUALT_Bualt10G0112000 [Buddleja alternifolia]